MWGRGAGSQARPRLKLEQLEERIAPAGNVVVTVSGGSLTMTGDADANEFMIEGSGPSEFRITPGPGTTLNSAASDVIVSNITGIKMALGDGDDSVVLNGITLANNVVVDTGGGDNSLVVTSASSIGGALTMKSNSAYSQDHLEINGCHVARNVSVTTKTGGQTVDMLGSDIGGSVSMKIQHLDGDGSHLIHTSTVAGCVSLAIGQGYHVFGSDPGDSIPFTIQHSSVGSVAVQAKGGDYSFSFVDSHTSEAKKGGIKVSYGSGDSYTYIGADSTIYGSVSAKTGTKYSWLDRLFNVAWDTQFTMEDSIVNGKLAVSNLDSDDTVTVHASHVCQGASISNGTGDATVNLLYVIMKQDGGKAYPCKVTSGSSGWGFEDDTVSLQLDEVLAGSTTLSVGPQKATIVVNDLNVEGSFSVTTGADNDTAWFGNMDVTKNISIRTGAGDDTVTITKHNSPHGSLTLDTGAGNDWVGLDTGAHDEVSDYYGKVKVTLGAGDDQMRVGEGWFEGNVGRYYAATVFDGGAGTDSIVYLGNGNIFSNVPPVVTNFESVT